MIYKNAEGYTDYVAGKAIREADRPPGKVTACVREIRSVARRDGLEICGRIWLRDPVTGREYR